MTAAEIARAVLELWGGDQSRWIQGAYARSADGKLAEPTWKNATCWCLIGACYRVLDRNLSKGFPEAPALRDALGNRELASFNDTNSFEVIEAKLREIAGMA